MGTQIKKIRRARSMHNKSWLFVLLLLPLAAQAQNRNTGDYDDEIKIGDGGKLVIIPSQTSSANDFNFLAGRWRVKNRRLKSVLTGSNDWEEFETTIETHSILLGKGCREKYSGKVHGSDYEAIAVRLFNPDTKLWTDHWADSSGGGFEENPPVGSFTRKTGHFFAKDRIKGLDVIVLYQWDVSDPEHPVWSQAFSTDQGKTWEWNWYMKLSRI